MTEYYAGIDLGARSSWLRLICRGEADVWLLALRLSVVDEVPNGLRRLEH